MGWVVSVTPRPRFTPGERTPCTHCTGSWVGPRAGLDTDVRRKILLPLPDIELQLPGRPVRSQTLLTELLGSSIVRVSHTILVTLQVPTPLPASLHETIPTANCILTKRNPFWELDWVIDVHDMNYSVKVLSLEGIHLSDDKVNWRVLVNTTTNFRVQRRTIQWQTERLYAFQTLLHGVRELLSQMPELNPGRGKGFFLQPLCPDRLCGPPSILSNGYPGFFLGGKTQPRRDADHSPTSSAEIKNEL
jgi:hypothetical protein